MALSKLAIGLIAGISSVATVGGITAGVVVSRQNKTQTIDSSNDEFNKPKPIDNKQDSSVNNRDEKNSSVKEMAIADDASKSVHEDKAMKNHDEKMVENDVSKIKTSTDQINDQDHQPKEATEDSLEAEAEPNNDHKTEMLQGDMEHKDKQPLTDGSLPSSNSEQEMPNSVKPKDDEAERIIATDMNIDSDSEGFSS